MTPGEGRRQPVRRGGTRPRGIYVLYGEDGPESGCRTGAKGQRQKPRACPWTPASNTQCEEKSISSHAPAASGIFDREDKTRKGEMRGGREQ